MIEIKIKRRINAEDIAKALVDEGYAVRMLNRGEEWEGTPYHVGYFIQIIEKPEDLKDGKS